MSDPRMLAQDEVAQLIYQLKARNEEESMPVADEPVMIPPRCVCGGELTAWTTNTSRTEEHAHPGDLVTVKRNYVCHGCHAQVTIVHHSGDDPGGYAS